MLISERERIMFVLCEFSPSPHEQIKNHVFIASVIIYTKMISKTLMFIFFGMLGKDSRRTRVANAYYSLFMAIGNILGYATGSYSGWYKIFPFTLSPACTISCANLKSALFLDIAFIAVTTYISIMAAHEVPLNSNVVAHAEAVAEESGSAEEAFMWELFGTFKYFSTPVWIILSVTALTWTGWFPFTLFDTDWMGREIYGGDPNQGLIYDTGVRMGALGLLLNSVVLALTSLLMERLCRKRGAGFVWGISNIVMTFCFLAMLVLTYVASSMGYAGKDLPPPGIVIAALIIFTILGFPLAVSCPILLHKAFCSFPINIEYVANTYELYYLACFCCAMSFVSHCPILYNLLFFWGGTLVIHFILV